MTLFNTTVTLSESGTTLLIPVGAPYGRDGYLLRFVGTGWTGSVVLKENQAPPGSALNLVNVPYQNLATLTDVTAGTAITATYNAIVQRSGYDLYAVYTHTAGSVAVITQPWSAPNQDESDDIGFIQAGTGAVERLLQDKVRETLSVTDFGAVGDGVTDDTAAIQAAVTAAGDGEVLIPEGDYLISSPIVMATGGATLRGVGYGSNLVLADTFDAEGNHDDAGAIDLDSVNNITIRDLRITCTDSITSSGVTLDRCNECVVENVFVRAPQTSTPASGYGIWIFGLSRRNVVSKCVVVDAGYSSFDCAQGPTGQPNGNVWVGNRSVNPTENAFDIYRTQKTVIVGNVCVGPASGSQASIRLTGGTALLPNQGCVVANNTMDDIPSDGITLIDVCLDCTVQGNTVGNGGNKGIILSGSGVQYCTVANNTVASVSSNGIEVNGGTYNIIANNVCRGSVTLNGILLSGADFNVVRGNACVLNAQHGISLSSSDDNLVSGNFVKDNSQLTNNTYDGIHLTSANTNTVEGNMARYDSGLANDQRRGVAINSGSNNAVIGNDLRTSGATGAFAGGTATVVRNNLGYTTENNGTATVANGTTSIAVTHGLSATPSLDDISVTPTNNLGTATKFWITSPTSTQFTINVDADPGAGTATFAWTASIQ